MAYRSSEFRRYFLANVGQSNSANNYRWSLDRLDEAIGGIDLKVAEAGPQGVRDFIQSQDDELFRKYRSSIKSAFKSYIDFLSSSNDDSEDFAITNVTNTAAEAIVEVRHTKSTLLQYEDALQHAVRENLSSLDPGLSIADFGVERRVATGFTDILAVDSSQNPVVIELKVGDCPKGALEQLLGYIGDVESELGRSTTGYLVAASFSDRIKAAAKRVSGVKLMTYRLKVEFDSADD